ncbi:MAG: hypothetical protein DRJ62_07170 [Thermoprotei archaeon]|nr:MAG: hypothetical protein DRJ62_07170 [Thermoprotei archaeon]
MEALQRIAVAAVIAVLLVSSLAIFLHQWICYGVIWEWDQVLHHENYVLLLAVLALGVAVGYRLGSK